MRINNLTRLRSSKFPSSFNVKITEIPKTTHTESPYKNYTRYSSFLLGTSLIISEILPFTNNEFNGITHAIQTLYKINKEYKSNF